MAVVCQPDRPAGRGLRCQPPPVKIAAVRMGLEVHQPVKVRTGDLHEWLRARNVDAAVVLAYGRILPPSVLAAPRLGCINLHASVLPRWRGAAPIQWAIMAGDASTGVSLMQMDEGLDTGPVYSIRTLSIAPGETAGVLSERIAELCATVIREDLPCALQGTITAVAQDESVATYAPPITREHCTVDWNSSATLIESQVRGLAPRPGARTWLDGRCFRLLNARAVPDDAAASPGSVRFDGACRVLISTGMGALELLDGQVEGRRVCNARDLVNGRAIRTDSRFGLAR